MLTLSCRVECWDPDLPFVVVVGLKVFARSPLTELLGESVLPRVMPSLGSQLSTDNPPSLRGC